METEERFLKVLLLIRLKAPAILAGPLTEHCDQLSGPTLARPQNLGCRPKEEFVHLFRPMAGSESNDGILLGLEAQVDSPWRADRPKTDPVLQPYDEECREIKSARLVFDQL